MLKKLLLLFLLPSVHCPAQELTGVLTYNIRFDNPADGPNAWPLRRDQLAAQVLFYEPDIVGLQEVLHSQLVFLQEKWTAFDYAGVGRDDGLQAGEYSPIFYRKSRYDLLEKGNFWLSPTPDVPSRGWDAALNRICTFVHLHDRLARRNLWVFNSHFDHLGREAREKSAALIVRIISEMAQTGEGVVVMGDLNAEPETPPVEALAALLSDASLVSDMPAFGPAGTFNGFNFAEPVRKRIDYIFVRSAQIGVRKYAVLSDSREGRYYSDHLPVFSQLYFR